ncbi:MAG: ABC transporter permease [Candidatus Ranarchaeia archaeon]
MKLLDIFRYSGGAISKRKFRTGLTALGVLIGIAAIVALLSLSTGFSNEIDSQFQAGFSTDTLIVSPGSGFMGFGGDSDFVFYDNDTDLINDLGNVSNSVATAQKLCTAVVDGKETFVSVIGVNYTDYAAIYSASFVALYGEIPTTITNETLVIGYGLYSPFQNETTYANVTDSIELYWTTRNGSVFQNITTSGTVYGVLDEIGGISMSGPSDNAIYMPMEYALEFFDTQEVDQIVVQVTEDDDATRESVTAAILELFDDHVSVLEPTMIFETLGTVLTLVELFLAGIASISLLVAGIGIMNIMIVSLMERTREIGILKALGTKNRTVLMIFVTEAVIIGLIGGISGIITGYTIAQVASIILATTMTGGGFGGPPGISAGTSGFSIVPVLTLDLALFALGFGLLVSVVFALYPAWRASKLNPVDALRAQ